MFKRLKKIRSFFKKEHADDEILEVELWTLGTEGINQDEWQAWQIIKEIYEDILIDDENWHFFYENYYNIIRCSAKFYPKVIKRLQDLGIYYKEKGKWIDGQQATRKHQKIFQGLFHYFTLMALRDYDFEEITGIYDRISHCFLNHQYFVLEEFRSKYGHQWESYIMSHAAISRADYSAYSYYSGSDPSKSFKIDTSEKPILDQINDGSFIRKTSCEEEEDD